MKNYELKVIFSNKNKEGCGKRKVDLRPYTDLAGNEFGICGVGYAGEIRLCPECKKEMEE